MQWDESFSCLFRLRRIVSLSYDPHVRVILPMAWEDETRNPLLRLFPVGQCPYITRCFAEMLAEFWHASFNLFLAFTYCEVPQTLLYADITRGMEVAGESPLKGLCLIFHIFPSVNAIQILECNILLAV